jgi:hypothetical protein
MEPWVGSVRRGILDRILIINAAHPRAVLAEFETHFNAHRPHRSLNQASPLRALPDLTDTEIKIIAVIGSVACSTNTRRSHRVGRVFGTADE